MNLKSIEAAVSGHKLVTVAQLDEAVHFMCAQRNKSTTSSKVTSAVDVFRTEWDKMLHVFMSVCEKTCVIKMVLGILGSNQAEEVA